MITMRGTRGARWLALLVLGALGLGLPGSSWLGLPAADGQAKEFRVGVALSLMPFAAIAFGAALGLR